MDRDSRPTDRMEYLDFDLEIGRGRARRYPVTARSTVTGEAHAEMRFPYTEQVLENRLLALELAVLQLSGTRRRIASPKEQTAQDFGKVLFDALFTGDLRSLYGESLRAAEQQGKGLRIRLHIEPPELAALPWEFLYDTRRGEYMCLSSQTPIVRYPDLPQSIEQLPVTPPLRILGMVVDAADLAALDVAQEKARVEAALKDL